MGILSAGLSPRLKAIVVMDPAFFWMRNEHTREPRTVQDGRPDALAAPSRFHGRGGEEIPRTRGPVPAIHDAPLRHVDPPHEAVPGIRSLQLEPSREPSLGPPPGLRDCREDAELCIGQLPTGPAAFLPHKSEEPGQDQESSGQSRRGRDLAEDQESEQGREHRLPEDGGGDEGSLKVFQGPVE